MAAEPDIVARMKRQARTSPWLAIHRASDRLRQTFGEMLPEMGRDDAKLAKVLDHLAHGVSSEEGRAPPPSQPVQIPA